MTHIALEEAGATFKAVRVAIADGDHRSANYLAINPRGLVPALEINGRIHRETIALLTLLHGLYPEARLLPSDDPYALCRAYELLSFFATSVHVVGFSRVFRARRRDLGAPPDAKTQAADRKLLLGYLHDIESMLAGQQWLLGDCYSAADGYPLTFRRWARRNSFDMDLFPNGRAHAQLMVERPAVRRAIATEGLDAAEF